VLLYLYWNSMAIYVPKEDAVPHVPVTHMNSGVLICANMRGTQNVVTNWVKMKKTDDIHRISNESEDE